MYLNGLYEPLLGILQLLVAKTLYSVFKILELPDLQLTQMEVCYAY